MKNLRKKIVAVLLGIGMILASGSAISAQETTLVTEPNIVESVEIPELAERPLSAEERFLDESNSPMSGEVALRSAGNTITIRYSVPLYADSLSSRPVGTISGTFFVVRAQYGRMAIAHSRYGAIIGWVRV